METTLVKVFGETHTVQFPNVGQHMDIEAMKQSLTNGKYGEMVRAGVKTSDRNLDLVDAISTFSVLLPKIKDRFSGSLLSIEIKAGLELAKSYTEQYVPWYNNIMNQLDLEYKGLADAAKTKSEVV